MDHSVVPHVSGDEAMQYQPPIYFYTQR